MGRPNAGTSQEVLAAAKEKAEEEDKAATAALVAKAQEKENSRKARGAAKDKVDNFNFGLSRAEAVEITRTRILERDGTNDGSKIMVGILGSANMSEEAEEIVRTLALVCARLADHAVFLTTGMDGSQRLFTDFCNSNMCYNILASGERHVYQKGRYVTAGANPKERDEVFQTLAHVLLLIEGGERSAVVAMDAQDSGTAVIPLRITGGASAGMYGCDCKKPMFATVHQWEMLSNEKIGVEMYVENVCQLIRSAASSHKEKDAGNALYAGFLRRQAKAEVRSTRGGTADPGGSGGGPVNGLQSWTAGFYRTRAKLEKAGQDFIQGDMSGYRRWPTRSAEDNLKEEAEAIRNGSPFAGSTASPSGSPRSPGSNAPYSNFQHMSVAELEESIANIDQRKVLMMMELQNRGAAHAQNVFGQMDANNDGVVTAEEFNRAYKKTASR